MKLRSEFLMAAGGDDEADAGGDGLPDLMPAEDLDLSTAPNVTPQITPNASPVVSPVGSPRAAAVPDVQPFNMFALQSQVNVRSRPATTLCLFFPDASLAPCASLAGDRSQNSLFSVGFGGRLRLNTMIWCEVCVFFQDTVFHVLDRPVGRVAEL